MTLRNLLYCALLVIGAGCIDQFEKSTFYEPTSILVVDGTIDNDPAPDRIVLTYALTFSSTTSIIYVEGASVSLSGSDGTFLNLQEETTGVFLTPAGFKGIEGVNYQLEIMLENGKRYRSENVTIPPSIAIDTLRPEVATIIATDPLTQLPTPKESIMVYLSVNSPETDQKYFRWRIEETHEEYFPLDPDPCYFSERPREFLVVGSTENTVGDVITDLPLRFVPKEKLFTRYSILVEQFTLSKKAYLYWEAIYNQRKRTGSIFDPPPTSVEGNMVCVTDPSELVLGFFAGAGKSSKRLFVRPLDFPGFLQAADTVREECSPQPGAEPAAHCYECTLLQGRTRIRPNFW